MMKWVMTAMIALSVVFGIVGGNMDKVSEAFLSECGEAVELAVSLIGIICLWSGLMRVAQAAGVTELLAQLFSPILSKLFKNLKKGGKALQLITLNLTANLLGLGNASTPFGIAAMREIEAEENLNSDHANHNMASHSMIVFTVMNTASLQIIPTTVAALRLKYGSADPMAILPCVWIVSLLSLSAALLATKVFQKIADKRRAE